MKVTLQVLVAVLALGCAEAASSQDAAPHSHSPAMDASEPMHDMAAATDVPPGETPSEREHVAPDPPQSEIPSMPYREMAQMMAMDDRALIGKVTLDRLEWRDVQGGSSLEWDAAAWYGSDYNKLYLKAEGERQRDTTDDARNELLWDRIISRWWSLQAGVREDLGEGPSRTWAALGIQGLAPYFFQVEATAYVGEGGRTAARVSSEYDLRITQRLILQPEAELNLYGKEDPENRIGAGLSDLQVGLRLRYEIKREFAPYAGLVWSKRFGRSATLARMAGEDANDVQLLAGLRIWF